METNSLLRPISKLKPNNMNELELLKQKVTELEVEIKSIKAGNIDYFGIEAVIKRNIFDDIKIPTSGTTPVYTAYSYSGVGGLNFSSMNPPDDILPVNINGKRYWIPVFLPN